VSWGQTPRKELELHTLADGLGRVAEQLLEVVKGEGQNSISMGRVQGPAQDRASFGPGLVKMLADAIEARQKGAINPSASLSLTGRYAVVEDKADPTRLVLKITLQILSRKSDDVIQEFVSTVRGNSDIALAAGHHGPLSPEGDAKQRNRELKRHHDQPTVFLDGPRVRTHKNSPFAVEVRAKREGQPADAKAILPVEKDGRAFIDLKPGDLYEVVLHNDDSRVMAADVRIDGISAFAFSELRDDHGKPRYTHYILAPMSTGVVVGWHKRNSPPDNYLSFLVTDYGKGASQFIPAPQRGEPGLIHVAFSRTAPLGKGRGGSETGLGPPRDVNVTEVALDIEPADEFISIRYSR
jgi:hypothetical protein